MTQAAIISQEYSRRGSSIRGPNPARNMATVTKVEQAMAAALNARISCDLATRIEAK
jgi:hypothetical protein